MSDVIQKSEFTKTDHKAMICEDNVDLASLMSLRFKKEGWDTTTSCDPQSALSLISKSDLKVDVLVTDQMMPGMSGIELIEKMRLCHSPPRLYVLYSGDISLDKEEIERSDVLLVRKPTDMKTLMNSIKIALSKMDRELH